MTFGGVDKNFCEEVIGWAPVSKDATQWEFTVDKLSIGGYKWMRPARVIINPASINMIIPMEQLSKIAIQLNARFFGGEFTVPCDKTWALQLTINGKDYEIAHEHMIHELGENKCQLLIQSSPTGKVDVWTLGAPFTRSHCIVHQWEKREIGFAKVKSG